MAMALNVRYIARYAKFHMDKLMLGKNIFAAFIMGFSIDFIYSLLTVHGLEDIVAIFIVMVMGTVIYGLLLVLLGGITLYDINRIPLFGEKLGSLLIRWRLVKL